MEAIEEEMTRLQTQQRQCITWLQRADALRRIDNEHRQDIRVVSSWSYECGAHSD